MDPSAPPVLTVYGAYWCPDCRRAKQFLGEHRVAAGDVRAGSTKQVASAIGEGAAAALVIRDYLKTV